eukprot:688280-Amphidinium_carterae.2
MPCEDNTPTCCRQPCQSSCWPGAHEGCWHEEALSRRGELSIVGRKKPGAERLDLSRAGGMMRRPLDSSRSWRLRLWVGEKWCGDLWTQQELKAAPLNR